MHTESEDTTIQWTDSFPEPLITNDNKAYERIHIKYRNLRMAEIPQAQQGYNVTECITFATCSLLARFPLVAEKSQSPLLL